MLNNEQMEELVQPVIDIYNKLEYELMIEVAQRFKNADTVKGALEWQFKKLDELGGVNQNLVKIIKKYSGKAEDEIISMLNAAGFANIDTELLQTAFELGAISVDPVKMMQSPAIADTINLSYKSLKNTFSLINTRAIESAKQSYLNILNTAYLDTASGMHSLQESVKKGIQRMARKGYTGATYKRDGKIVEYSIEGVVRRDTLTAVHQLANKVSEQSCEIMNAEYVEISKHLGARVHPTNKIANHAGWQGKVFKIHGCDDEYDNLKESTGYPDDILGLGGVNCRHRMFPFFPGISIQNPIRFDEEENRKHYEATQHQRRLEREIRSLKKQKACADAIDDKDTSAMLNYKLNRKYEEINEYCAENGLTRDYSRELVSEQIKSKYPLEIISKNAFTNEENYLQNNNVPKMVKTIDYNDRNAIIKELEDFEKESLNMEYERNCTVTSDGKVWYIDGSSGFVESELIETQNGGSSLKASYSYHNHTEKETNFSFSGNDVGFFLEKEETYSKASDYKYSYIMERTEDTLKANYYDIISEFKSIYETKALQMSMDELIDIDEDGYHEVMKILSKKYGFYYERIKKNG